MPVTDHPMADLYLLAASSKMDRTPISSETFFMQVAQTIFVIFFGLIFLSNCKLRIDNSASKSLDTATIEKLKRGLVNHHRDFSNKYAEIMKEVERTTSKRIVEIVRLVPGVKATTSLFKPFRDQTTTADRLRSLAAIQMVIQDSYRDLLEAAPSGYNPELFMALMEPYWAKTAVVHRLAGTTVGMEADQLLTGLGQSSMLAVIVARTKATLNEHVSYALSRLFLESDGRLSPQLASVAKNALAGLEKINLDEFHANAVLQYQGLRATFIQNKAPGVQSFDEVLSKSLGKLKDQIGTLVVGSKQNLKKVLAQYAIHSPQDGRSLYASSNSNSPNYNWKHDQWGRVSWYIGSNKHNPFPAVGLLYAGAVGGGGHAQVNFYPLYQKTYEENLPNNGKGPWFCSLTQLLIGVGSGAGLVYGPSFSLAGVLQEIPISMLAMDHGAGIGAVGTLGVSTGLTGVGLSASFSITGIGDRFYVMASLNAQFSGPTVPGGTAYFGSGEAFHFNTCGDESLEYLEI